TWTTVPAFVIAFILFALISPSISTDAFSAMTKYQNELQSTGLVTWIGGLVPILVLILFSSYKVPTLLSFAASSITSLFVALMLKNASLSNVMDIVFGGYTSETGFNDIDELLSRGGMQSMFDTITIVLLALSLG